jgi:hypothetical protein
MIYEIGKTGDKKPRPLDTGDLAGQGWKEKDLENYLFNNLRDFLSSDLMLVSQSKPGEQPDLVALDRDGELWLFELKRGGGRPFRESPTSHALFSTIW